MFGYVRPCAGRFQEGELAGYKAAYCGLCRTMGLRHGFLARFSLNYDFTFLVMILGGGTPQCAPCRRCPAHPFQPRPMCENSPELEAAADESVILTYHKLRDDILDNGLLRALPARMAALALRRAYRRAADARPQFDRTVRQCLDELHRRQRETPVETLPERAETPYDALPLQEALERLPEDLRSVIALRYFGGFTLAETAQALGLPEGTVSSRQRRALQLLKLHLTDDEEVSP